MSQFDWRMLLRRNNSSPVDTFLRNKVGGDWLDWMAFLFPAVFLSSPEISVSPSKEGFHWNGDSTRRGVTHPHQKGDFFDRWRHRYVDELLAISEIEPCVHMHGSWHRASRLHVRQPIKWLRHYRELVEGATQRTSRNVSMLKDFGCRVFLQDTPEERKKEGK